MTAVFRNQDDIAVVDRAWIERVKENAAAEPLRRARLNLHRSENDLVQEMLIAVCDDSLNPPHRHVGKTESLHALEGRARIVFFDGEGTVTREIEIGGPGTDLPRLYRLSAPLWHTVIALDPIVVVHEILTGPFRTVTDPPPKWVPQDERSLRAFIAHLRPAREAKENDRQA